MLFSVKIHDVGLRNIYLIYLPGVATPVLSEALVENSLAYISMWLVWFGDR